MVKRVNCPYCHGTINIEFDNTMGVHAGITQCNAFGGCDKDIAYKITVGVIKTELFKKELEWQQSN